MTIQQIKEQLDKEKEIRVQTYLKKTQEENRKEEIEYNKFIQSLSGLNHTKVMNKYMKHLPTGNLIDVYYTDDLNYIYFVMGRNILQTRLGFYEKRIGMIKDIVSELQSENCIEELMEYFLYNYNRDSLIEACVCGQREYKIISPRIPDNTSPKVKLALDIIKGLIHAIYYRLDGFNKIEIPTPCKQTETSNKESKQDNNQSFLDKLISIFK